MAHEPQHQQIEPVRAYELDNALDFVPNHYVRSDPHPLLSGHVFASFDDLAEPVFRHLLLFQYIANGTRAVRHFLN